MTKTQRQTQDKTEAPTFQFTVRPRAGKPVAAARDSKSLKRDNIFSKCRDTREERASRQMKNTKSAQTFPHAR